MTVTFSDDSGLLNALAAAISEATTRPCFVIEVPPDAGATIPYQILDPSSGSWDRGMLERAQSCGWRGVQLRSVGKGTDKNGTADYSWLAGKARAAIVDGLVVTGDGWQATDGYSDGPPDGAETGGRLTAVVERFEFYVQPA